MQGLLLEVYQDAAPDAYAKRTKRQGIVSAWMDDDFAQAVGQTGELTFESRAMQRSCGWLTKCQRQEEPHRCRRHDRRLPGPSVAFDAQRRVSCPVRA